MLRELRGGESAWVTRCVRRAATAAAGKGGGLAVSRLSRTEGVLRREGLEGLWPDRGVDGVFGEV